MKQFIVDRHTTPNTPTLEQVPTEKIPIYENRAAVEADLANLTDGQIVATADTGDELAHPVDAVEEGNLHAVTSNAVAEMFLNPNSNDFAISFSNQTATVTGFLYCTVWKRNNASVVVQEDNTELLRMDMYTTSSSLNPFTILVRKGHQYKIDKSGDTSATIYSQKFVKLF